MTELLQNWKVLSFAFCIVMSGCAKQSTVPLSLITRDGLKTISAGSTSKTELVVDASVAKEIAVMQTLQNRDNQIAQAAQSAGMKMDYKAVTETIQVPGMREPIVMTRQIPIVSYTPMPEFNQPLPTAPSAHPAWRLGEKIVEAGVWGLVGHEIGSVLKAGINAAGSKTNINSGGGDIASSGNLNNQRITQKAGGNIHSNAETAPCQGEGCGGEEIKSKGGGACTDPAIFGQGIYWIDRVGGCSCASREAGHC